MSLRVVPARALSRLAALAVIVACASCAHRPNEAASALPQVARDPKVRCHPDPGVRTDPGETLPRLGEYQFADELPEAIERPGPDYPRKARRAGIRGTVHVNALVLKDGRVGGACVAKSIRELDKAALACVRKWRFKPARLEGKPVAVWVGLPIHFEP